MEMGEELRGREVVGGNINFCFPPIHSPNKVIILKHQLALVTSLPQAFCGYPLYFK